MHEDVITNDFTGGINIQLMKKILLLAKLLFGLNLIYCVTQIYLWYNLVSKTLDFDMSRMENFYNYRVQPVIMLVLFLLNVFCYSINIRSFALLTHSIEESNAAMFNKGCALMHKVVLITIVSLSIIILNSIILLLLK